MREWRTGEKRRRNNSATKRYGMVLERENGEKLSQWNGRSICARVCKIVAARREWSSMSLALSSALVSQGGIPSSSFA